MLNFLNNFFKSAEQKNVESSTSSDDGNHQKEREKKKEEPKYLEREEPDEVRIGGRPELTEEEVWIMTVNYIENLKVKNMDREKVLKKLDKYLENFDVKKFMKNNPHMTHPDFYMVIFNETDRLVN